MRPFTTLTAIAAPLPIDNVDTDMIIPKQFLKTIKRTGLKEGLFYEMRFRVDGSRVDDFVLHNPPFDKAEILLSGANFGCGSSREHAPWALLDFGIRCVIAESFADIFFNNCFKNGILPIVLPKENIDTLMKAAEAGQQLTVDLEKQTVTSLPLKGGGPGWGSLSSAERVADPHPNPPPFRGREVEYAFTLEPFRKHCLLNGLDDIGLTLQKLDAIAAYEQKQKQLTPWLAA